MEDDPVDDTLTCIVFDTEGDLVLSIRLFVIEGDPVGLIVNQGDTEGDTELDEDNRADCEAYALI